MLSEKPYNKLHVKIFFTFVKTARAGRTEVMVVAAQNCHMITRRAGKGLSN